MSVNTITIGVIDACRSHISMDACISETHKQAVKPEKGMRHLVFACDTFDKATARCGENFTRMTGMWLEKLQTSELTYPSSI